MAGMAYTLESELARLHRMGRHAEVRFGMLDEITFTTPMRVELDDRGIECSVAGEVIDRGDDKMIALNFLRRLDSQGTARQGSDTL